ncbi:hypothetical protein OQA88_1252 [Cercophora sp. LCS_1]
MDLPLYTYDNCKLGDPSSGIRLLSFLHIAPGEPISCALQEIPTLASATYHCLSYTWGDPFGRDDKHCSDTANPAKSPPDQDREQQQPESSAEEKLWAPTLIIDGKSALPIGRNLYDALVHISVMPSQRAKLSAIWIDAVCIDQSNDAEIGCQIKMMHAIYAGASSVVIWLGPDISIPTGSDPAKLRVVAATVRAQLGNKAVAGSASWDLFLAELHDGEVVERREDLAAIQQIEADAWRAVGELASREYWQRLWVWQEVIAARKEPVVVCGLEELAWEDLRLASHARIVFPGAKLGHGEVLLRRGMRTRNFPYQMAWWRDQYRARGTDWLRQKFGRLVLSGNRNAFVCGDERDKIFAHAGLCGRTELAAWDYARPFEELYVHWWCEIMQRVQEVNFLTFVEDAGARKLRPQMKNDARHVELPSWVPDLRCCLEPPSMWDFFQGSESFDISRDLEGKFPSGYQKSTANGLEVVPERRQLRMWGYRFDAVRMCGESTDEAQRLKAVPKLVALFAAMVRSISNVSEGIPHSGDGENLPEPPSTAGNPYGTVDGACDAVWTSMALLADTDADPSFPIPEEHKKRAMLWMCHAMAYGSILGAGNAYTREQDQILQELGDVGGEELRTMIAQYACAHRTRLQGESAAEPIEQQDTQGPSSAFSWQPGVGSVGMAALASGDWGLLRMRVFLTVEGWVGKGPESMAPGDELWIVPGAKIAFVLRRMGQVFSYVGHAYVHGMMGGKASHRFRGLDMEEIVLN